jgi:hypothetical protein
MFSQSRVRSAITRTTLVLSLVCLSATGVLAATETQTLSSLATIRSQGQQASAAAPLPTPPVGMSRSTDKQSDQGRQYGQPGFVGEPINLNVVNADIRDILNYITEQYGVNFVIDASVGAVPVTVNVQDVPWNVALDAVLKANRLGIECQRQHPARCDDRRAGERSGNSEGDQRLASGCFTARYRIHQA